MVKFDERYLAVTVRAEITEIVCDSQLEFSDDEENKLIREFEAWAIAKQSELVEQGAIIYSVNRTDWSNWQ